MSPASRSPVLDFSSTAAQWVALGVILLIIGIPLAAVLYLDYHRTENIERERLASQAKIVDENLGNRLEAIYKTLDGVRRNKSIWASESSREDSLHLLQTLCEGMLGVRTINVINSAGIVIASNREQLLGRDFSGRAYFPVTRNGGDPAMMYLSPPFTTSLDVFAMNLTRVLLDGKGNFSGILAVTLDPAYFSKILDAIRYKPDLWSALAHGDGKQFMMVPEREGMAGLDLANPGSFFARHKESGRHDNVLTGLVLATGEERMMALRNISPASAHLDKPLVIAVGRPMAAIFTDWRHDAFVQGGMFLVLVLVSTSGLAIYQSRKREYARLLERHETERKQAEIDLRIAAAAFDSQEGMVITDANSIILRVNQAFTKTTGYGAGEVTGQTPRILKSGRHGPDFYRDMWESINTTGGWQGEIWDRRKNGEEYPKWLSISAVKDSNGKVTHYIGAHYDITERKRAEQKINELAFYDQLTGLPNRTLLMDRLKQAMATSTRNAKRGALLFIDLDNFKTLNDTLGHDMGDMLLKQVAQRLASSVREGDSVARLGGDEFVVMLEDLSQNPREAAPQAEIVGEKILARLNEKYQLASTVHYSTPSIGITLFSGHQESIDVLLKRADLAMYEAKSAGRNTLRFFDPEMQAIITNRAELEADLHEALLQNQFLLHYQAQIVDGQLTGAEVLLRWKHPQRGMVSPADFIPLAEESGLILPLGQWALETACRQLVAWSTQPDMAHLTVAVNVSALQFRQADFVDQILEVLAATGADPNCLKIELTESMLVANVTEIIEKMFALKAKGVGFALDDFGTGYSSLSYLKRLPLDQLKIDQSFVRDVLTDPNDAAIAKTVIALAESLGLGVIAEGVETASQRDFLADSGCHAYQGYFFSRPLPIADFEAFARQA